MLISLAKLDIKQGSIFIVKGYYVGETIFCQIVIAAFSQITKF